MDYFDSIFGNETLKQTLREQIKAGCFSHAHILEGPAGSGRFTMAKAICEALAAGRDQGKIAKDICPDVIYIKAPEGKSILSVDAIRAIREQVYLAPHELPFKAYLIFGADQMSEGAQNAFLKLLEEPPADVYFFLLCENRARLLPTVRSRASLFRMQLFSEEELTAYVQSQEAYASVCRDKPALFKRAVKDSAGSIGGVIKYMTEPETQKETCDTAVKALLEKLHGRDQGAFMLEADRIPDGREEMKRFLVRFAEAFRDVFCWKRGVKASLAFFDEPAQAEEYSFVFSEETLLKRWLFCLQCLEQAEYNLNVKTAKLHFLNGLWETAC
ncbi:MAG: hypothetical protein HFE78_03575 [Clostridiales bacterium]|nr:hypothetical protein [Clostridiales bacterium]